MSLGKSWSREMASEDRRRIAIAENTKVFARSPEES
jgi:hypothetical protein